MMLLMMTNMMLHICGAVFDLAICLATPAPNLMCCKPFMLSCNCSIPRRTCNSLKKGNLVGSLSQLAFGTFASTFCIPRVFNGNSQPLLQGQLSCTFGPGQRSPLPHTCTCPAICRFREEIVLCMYLAKLDWDVPTLLKARSC